MPKSDPTIVTTGQGEVSYGGASASAIQPAFRGRDAAKSASTVAMDAAVISAVTGPTVQDALAQLLPKAGGVNAPATGRMYFSQPPNGGDKRADLIQSYQSAPYLGEDAFLYTDHTDTPTWRAAVSFVPGGEPFFTIGTDGVHRLGPAAGPVTLHFGTDDLTNTNVTGLKDHIVLDGGGANRHTSAAISHSGKNTTVENALAFGDRVFAYGTYQDDANVFFRVGDYDLNFTGSTRTGEGLYTLEFDSDPSDWNKIAVVCWAGGLDGAEQTPARVYEDRSLRNDSTIQPGGDGKIRLRCHNAETNALADVDYVTVMVLDLD